MRATSAVGAGYLHFIATGAGQELAIPHNPDTATRVKSLELGFWPVRELGLQRFHPDGEQEGSA